ncbi:MAG: hypothetical protein LBJ15_00775 [Comamonas sp.]|jgi:hypothetical protein|uniref:hypothetical protein n=1 Tax=Comamonas sp. TaxID=34028 RepID=UPI00281E29E5|nr:hypothetical protein [Comamonas sp.]MDR0212520.1 hypothetical protein [Comamonas sp.]
MLKEEQLKQLNNALVDMGSRVALLEAAYAITTQHAIGDEGVKTLIAQLREIRSHLQMLGMPCKGTNILTTLEQGPADHNGATIR